MSFMTRRECRENCVKDYASIFLCQEYAIINVLYYKMFDGGTFTDFFMHYIGICYGIIVSGFYFIFIYKKWKQ